MDDIDGLPYDLETSDVYQTCLELAIAVGMNGEKALHPEDEMGEDYDRFPDFIDVYEYKMAEPDQVYVRLTELGRWLIRHAAKPENGLQMLEQPGECFCGQCIWATGGWGWVNTDHDIPQSEWTTAKVCVDACQRCLARLDRPDTWSHFPGFARKPIGWGKRREEKDE